MNLAIGRIEGGREGMKKLLVFSKCHSVKSEIEFHFKGFYRGEKVEKIVVHGKEIFKPGAEYLLWVKDLGVVRKELHVELIAWKLIFTNS